MGSAGVFVVTRLVVVIMTDDDGMMITNDEIAAGAVMQPHHDRDGWGIAVVMPNGSSRVSTRVNDEATARRLIDQTNEMLTRRVVVYDADGALVVDSEGILEAACWLDDAYEAHDDPANYTVLDRGNTYNGRKWLERLHFEGNDGRMWF